MGKSEKAPQKKPYWKGSGSAWKKGSINMADTDRLV